MQQVIKTTPIHSDISLVISDIYRVPEFIKFVEWFSTPRQLRKIKTQKEFAEVIGVCEDTLTDWKQHPQFRVLVQQNISEWIKERIPDVIHGLYKKALSKGNAKDVEMFLRLSGIDTN
jgi:hypothetical protein